MGWDNPGGGAGGAVHDIAGPQHTFPGGTGTFLQADGTFTTPSGKVESHINFVAVAVPIAF